ncbi:MAG: hypothetical protein B7Y39_12315 [Bdellovibrio sp. 28-41-41]|nr:MAG: hypothetical protein B7Y39_12315 [Bdellovibrio sp. 28-41-41]
MNFFKNFSFRAKLLLTVALACIICGTISVGVAIHYTNKEFHNGLVDKSRIIHGRLDVAAAYVAEQGGLKPIIERFTHKYKDSSETDRRRQIHNT